MKNIIPGQRWISNAEPELGLGLILEANNNQLTVLYLACGEQRIYARNNAPLTRAKFVAGDIIKSDDDIKLTVEKALNINGLITYACYDNTGKKYLLEEIKLNHHSQFNKPQDRLFSGQIDPTKWYKLRYQTWKLRQQLQQSTVRGLIGGRTSLIPHQLYIAQEATSRQQTRIMLADEVGLGKTIEAGLILHRLRLNDLAEKILILVPTSLVHQWLVEMVRKFNLRFSIFNAERCQEYGQDNPFMAKQLILCGQDFLNDNPQRQQQALQVAWDVVVIDEAHHLQWQEHNPSTEYQFVDTLSKITPNLILLTATPEQLGQKSHFARLRLLDPNRFYNFKHFLQEQKNFAPIATAANLLLQEQKLPIKLQQTLKKLLKTDSLDALLQNATNKQSRTKLINILLDHHGTGRLLFRNSRKTVKGLPERHCHAYPLTAKSNASENMQHNPYYFWLVGKLTELNANKALLICQQATMAMALAKALKQHAGIVAAVFHESMSIIERDRSAAYFSDPNSQAQLLICSEIGSEGRNFQFIHHLILFDLPANPDLLQQRIGRLDRIGQAHIIEIHVPYIQGTKQHLLYHWHQDALNSFSEYRSGNHQVYCQQQAELEALQNQFDASTLASFIKKSALLSQQFVTKMHAGRDRLLELNSCHQATALNLVTQIQQDTQQDDLWAYMEQVFDCYGVKTELHSPDCFIIKPGNHMRIDHFPELPEDGVTVTVKRATALVREDMQFLSWEHPISTAATELVLASGTGNTALSVIKHLQLDANQFLLECLFIVACSAPPILQVGRFLPPTPIRILLDQNHNDVSTRFAYQDLIEIDKTIDPECFSGFINNQRQNIENLLRSSRKQAEQTMKTLIKHSNQIMLATLNNEIKRLIILQKSNHNIKQEEIDHLTEATHTTHQCIAAAELKLDAIRLIIAS